MRRLIHAVIAVTIFAGGIALGIAWHARRVRSSTAATPLPIAQPSNEQPWPLNKTIVARSLQTHSFRTGKLRTNSDADVVWRWLKDSIARYPQNWVKLDLSDQHTYGVVLNPPKVLEPSELAR